MSDDFPTAPAEREALTVAPLGRYLEEFEVGAVYKAMAARRPVTESEITSSAC